MKEYPKTKRSICIVFSYYYLYTLIYLSDIITTYNYHYFITVADEIVNSIGKGINILVGICPDDTPKDIEYMWVMIDITSYILFL